MLSRSFDLYRKFVWFTLAVCVGVILWGAYVRASGSGAGCGSHWPLCNGVVLPETEQQKTFIEFSHRISSALLMIFVGGMALWAWFLFPKRNFARRAAILSFVAVLMEALVGAFLVLLRLVEQDKSVLRVASISLHLVNTLFLLGALTIAAISASHPSPRWRWPTKEGIWWPRGLLLGFAFLAAFGAVAALGDTLFPPTSLMQGFLADLSRDGHLAERIRIFHPLLAVAWVGAFAYWAAELWQRIPNLKRLGQLALSLSALNLLLGLANLFFLAPLPLQMLHLLVADLLWIVFISLLFSAASRWR